MKKQFGFNSDQIEKHDNSSEIKVTQSVDKILLIQYQWLLPLVLI